jgi:hypothetical protein
VHFGPPTIADVRRGGEAFMATTPDGADRKTSSGKDDSSSKKRWFKKPAVWISTLASAVIAGVLVNLATGGLSDAVPHRGAAPNIEVDAVSLSPGLVVSSEAGPSKITPFKVDIKLLNTGTQLAAINDARLVIQKFVKVPQCASQGGFTSTGYYNSNIPLDPRPGTVINIPISQLVEPDGADRFDLLLRAPLQSRSPATSYLYRIHVYLDYNTGANAVDVGEILVGLPFYPDDNDGYFWTHYFAGHPKYFTFEGEAAPGIERCMIRNSRALSSILSLPGKRTAAVSAIPAQLAFCCAAKRDDS